MSKKDRGILDNPISTPDPVRAQNLAEYQDEIDAALSAQLQDRVQAVFNLYGVENYGNVESWKNLAINLMADKFPGFHPPRVRHGRPRGSGIDPLEVYRAVNHWRATACSGQDGKPSVAEAARFFETDRFKEVTAKRIEDLYSIGRKLRCKELTRIARAVWIAGNLYPRYEFALGPKFGSGRQRIASILDDDSFGG